MPDGRRRIDLVGGFIDGKLDDEHRDELLRQVQDDPRALDQLRRQSLLHGILSSSASGPLDADAVMANLGDAHSPVERAVMGYVMAHAPAAPPARVVATPAPRRWRLSWPAALGWMAAAATAAYFLWPRPPVPVATHDVPAQIAPAPDESATAPAPVRPAPQQPTRPFAIVSAASRGVVILADGESRPARVGEQLRSGDGLLTGAGDGRAILLLSDGSRVDVAPDSVVPRMTAPAGGEAGGGRLFLARGVLLIVRAPATVARAGDLRVDAPHGSVLLASARVRVQVGGDGTRLDVNAGRARFAPAGADASELTAGQYALSAGEGGVTRGTRGARRALLLAGAKILSASDTVIRTRIERLGFDVTTATSATFDLTVAADSTLLVVSSTVSPQDVDARVRDLPVPILTWEAGLYPVLGMTGRCEDGDCGFHQLKPFTLDIKDPGHPLAAGQSGVVDLAWTDKIGWGVPNINAAWVATITGYPTRAAIFAYDRGAVMPGLVAPARRVGFFLYDSTAETTPRAAVSWPLFERAVLWCLD